MPDHLGPKSCPTWIMVQHHPLRAHSLYQTGKLLSGEKLSQAGFANNQRKGREHVLLVVMAGYERASEKAALSVDTLALL